MKKLIVFFIMTVILCSSGFAYFRQLGEGCIAGDYYVGCEENCELVCEGNSLVRRCRTAHGWCFTEEGCEACDYVHDVNDECSRTECSELNSIVPNSEKCGITSLTSQNLYQTVREYTCFDSSCNPSRKTVLTEENSERCCPPGKELQGNLLNIQESNDFLLEDEYHKRIDANGILVNVSIIWNTNPDAEVKVRAKDSDGNEIFVLVTSEDTVNENYLTLPIGTRTIDIVKEGNELPDIDYEINLFCELPVVYWGLDIDGDGVVSYIYEGEKRPSSCPSEITENECNTAKYWIKVSPDTNMESFEEDRNQNINPDTLMCIDKDGDLYHIGCEVKSEITDLTDYYPESELKGGDDCDDTNPNLNPETTFYFDNDRDGYWSRSVAECFSPGNKWLSEDEILGYDCNDDDENINQPEECSCFEEQEGTVYEGHFCYNTLEEEKTENLGAGEFVIKKEVDEYKWVNSSLREDMKGDEVLCPLETCPLAADAEYCVEPGTYWSEQGEKNEGSSLCEINNGKAFWSSRIAKINQYLVVTGENSGKDFSVYCGNFDNIAQTYKVVQESDFSNVRSQFNIISEDPNEVEACILIIDEGYISNVKEGNKPEQNDLKVILGFPIVFETDKYFGLNFENPSQDGNWKVKDSLYVYEPYNLLFILPGDGTVDNEVKGWFESADDNSALFNFLRILRNPIEYILVNTQSFSSELFNRFDLSYTGKNNNMHAYVSKEKINGKNIIVSKMSNIDGEFETFMNEICSEGYKGEELDCIIENNKIGFTANIQNDLDADNIFRSFSRQMRLMNNDFGIGDDFYDEECTIDDLNNCPEKECLKPSSCLNGVCLYEEIKEAIDDDGCCPPGFTNLTDNDCPESFPVIPLKSEIKDECEENEVMLFSISALENAHISLRGDYQHKVCIEDLEIVYNESSVISVYNDRNSHLGGGVHNVSLTHQEYNVECQISKECEGSKRIVSVSDDYDNTKNDPDGHVGEVGRYRQHLCCKIYDDGIYESKVDYEICNDGIDNDGDGLIDSEDPDCSGEITDEEFCGDGTCSSDESSETCPEDCATISTNEVCDDNVDNDNDGMTDCEDSDCADFVIREAGNAEGNCGSDECPSECAENGVQCITEECGEQGYAESECGSNVCPSECAENGVSCTRQSCGVAPSGSKSSSCGSNNCPSECADNGVSCSTESCTKSSSYAVCAEYRPVDGTYRPECSVVGLTEVRTYTTDIFWIRECRTSCGTTTCPSNVFDTFERFESCSYPSSRETCSWPSRTLYKQTCTWDAPTIKSCSWEAETC